MLNGPFCDLYVTCELLLIPQVISKAHTTVVYVCETWRWAALYYFKCFVVYVKAARLFKGSVYDCNNFSASWEYTTRVTTIKDNDY